MMLQSPVSEQVGTLMTAETVVALIPPEGQNMAFGLLGNQYTLEPDGTMLVHRDDVPPLLSAGYRRAA